MVATPTTISVIDGAGDYMNTVASNCILGTDIRVPVGCKIRGVRVLVGCKIPGVLTP